MPPPSPEGGGSAAKRVKQQPCAFCPPASDGASRSTPARHRLSYADVSVVRGRPMCADCAMYFPAPPTGSAEALQQRHAALRCGLCDSARGACVQCAHASCCAAFHVACALSDAASQARPERRALRCRLHRVLVEAASRPPPGADEWRGRGAQRRSQWAEIRASTLDKLDEVLEFGQFLLQRAAAGEAPSAEVFLSAAAAGDSATARTGLVELLRRGAYHKQKVANQEEDDDLSDDEAGGSGGAAAGAEEVDLGQLVATRRKQRLAQYTAISRGVHALLLRLLGQRGCAARWLPCSAARFGADGGAHAQAERADFVAAMGSALAAMGEGSEGGDGTRSLLYLDYCSRAMEAALEAEPLDIPGGGGLAILQLVHGALISADELERGVPTPASNRPQQFVKHVVRLLVAGVMAAEQPTEGCAAVAAVGGGSGGGAAAGHGGQFFAPVAAQMAVGVAERLLNVAAALHSGSDENAKAMTGVLAMYYTERPVAPRAQRAALLRAFRSPTTRFLLVDRLLQPQLRSSNCWKRLGEWGHLANINTQDMSNRASVKTKLEQLLVLYNAAHDLLDECQRQPAGEAGQAGGAGQGQGRRRELAAFGCGGEEARSALAVLKQRLAEAGLGSRLALLERVVEAILAHDVSGARCMM